MYISHRPYLEVQSNERRIKNQTTINQQITNLTINRVKGEISINEDLAKAFIDQENKVLKIKEDVEEKKSALVEAKRNDATVSDIKSRNARVASAQKELDEILKLLETEKFAFEERKNIETAFSNEVAEVRRRNALTDFERTVEDLNKKRTIFVQEINKRISDIQREINKQKEKFKETTSIDTAIAENAIAQSNAATNAVIADIDRVVSRKKSAAQQVISANSSIFGGSLFGATNSVFAPPSSVGGGGISVNIDSRGSIFGSDAAEEVGNQIMDRLKGNIRLTA